MPYCPDLKLNPNDIHYEYNTRGYMMYYKGKAIGGAGIDRYAKGSRSNLKLFRDSADSTKRKMLAGYIDRYMLDSILEYLWADFEDVPMNPETECIDAPFLHFPVGTFREDIWKWFDEWYSNGVADLLYNEH